ncbi:hypothetical protein ACLMJK_009012 [Lecanora helva]
MGHELHTDIFKRVLSKKRKNRLQSKFTKIRRIAKSRISQTSAVPVYPPRLTQDIEPVNIAQRVVFRSQGRLRVRSLVAFHALIKSRSTMATGVLSVLTDGEPTDPGNSSLHSAVRHIFEERLKTTAQLAGIFPTDPELTRPTQELFEQFFAAYGLPNEAESELLQRVAFVDAETIEAWCKHVRTYGVSELKMYLVTMKVFRLRGYVTVKRLGKQAMLKAFGGKAPRRRKTVSRPRLLKPYSRH